MQLPPTILSVDKHEKKKPATGSKLSSPKTPTKVTQKKQKEPVKEATPAAEAEERRRIEHTTADRPREVAGRGGAEPVRYGDWEVKGLATDF